MTNDTVSSSHIIHTYTLFSGERDTIDCLYARKTAIMTLTKVNPHTVDAIATSPLVMFSLL